MILIWKAADESRLSPRFKDEVGGDINVFTKDNMNFCNGLRDV